MKISKDTLKWAKKIAPKLDRPNTKKKMLELWAKKRKKEKKNEKK